MSTAAIAKTKIILSQDWCKKCGICVAFCPKHVLATDEVGRVVIAAEDQCIACRICERLCPDFAINIESEKED